MENKDYFEAFKSEEERIRSRFLEEAEKLIGLSREVHGRQINTRRALAWLITRNKSESLIGEIASGRYNVNVKILWTAKKYYPEFDVGYVLFGVRGKLT